MEAPISSDARKRIETYLQKAQAARENASLALSEAGCEMWEAIAKSWRDLAEQVTQDNQL